MKPGLLVQAVLMAVKVWLARELFCSCLSAVPLWLKGGDRLPDWSWVCIPDNFVPDCLPGRLTCCFEKRCHPGGPSPGRYVQGCGSIIGGAVYVGLTLQFSPYGTGLVKGLVFLSPCPSLPGSSSYITSTATVWGRLCHWKNPQPELPGEGQQNVWSCGSEALHRHEVDGEEWRQKACYQHHFFKRVP